MPKYSKYYTLVSKQLFQFTLVSNDIQTLINDMSTLNYREFNRKYGTKYRNNKSFKGMVRRFTNTLLNEGNVNERKLAEILKESWKTSGLLKNDKNIHKFSNLNDMYDYLVSLRNIGNNQSYEVHYCLQSINIYQDMDNLFDVPQKHVQGNPKAKIFYIRIVAEIFLQNGNPAFYSDRNGQYFYVNQGAVLSPSNYFHKYQDFLQDFFDKLNYNIDKFDISNLKPIIKKYDICIKIIY